MAILKELVENFNNFNVSKLIKNGYLFQQFMVNKLFYFSITVWLIQCPKFAFQI